MRVSVMPVMVRSEPRLRPREELAAVERWKGGWAWLGWFGAVMLVVSLADVALTWVPLELGRPEWEFGTVAASYAGLPLLATGLAALVSSAMGTGKAWLTYAVAGLLTVLALGMFAATGLFLLDVPLALKLSPAEVLPAIQKTIVKTVLLGTVFPVAFLVAAAAAVRTHLGRGGWTR